MISMPRMLHPWLLCVLLFAHGGLAQIVPLATIAPKAHAAIRAALAAGIPPTPRKAIDQPASRFARAKALVAVDKIAAGYATEPDDLASLRALFAAAIAKYDEAAGSSGLGDDLAGSLALLFVARAQVASDDDLPAGADDKVALQLQAALQGTAMAALADADKQAAFEWALSTVAVFLAMKEQAADVESRQRLAAAFDGVLAAALGVPAEPLPIGKDGLPTTRKAAAASAPGFAFTATNFDDGWVATEDPAGVLVQKADTRVLLHFTVEYTDATRNLDELARVLHFWNLLVGPRYQVEHIAVRPHESGVGVPYFGAGEGIDRQSRQKVHVALFLVSDNGRARCTEIVTPDAEGFRRQFPDDASMQRMVDYNKFAVGASDLPGSWSDSGSAYGQYYYASTGQSAGMIGAATADKFVLRADGSYEHEYVGVGGQIGAQRVAQGKTRGRYQVRDWQFSTVASDGKETAYAAQFEVVRGGRILHLQNEKYSSLRYHLVKAQ